MALKATVRPGLISGQFRHGPVHVKEGTWSPLDAEDAETRKVLLDYVPTHIRVMQGQDADLAAHGLSFKDGKLVETRTAAKLQDKNATTKRAEK